MKSKVFVIFLILNVSALAYCDGNVLKWESASNVSAHELLPSGRENVFTYYVARGRVKGVWLNGKSLFIGNEHVAYVPFYDQEAEGLDFQVLVAPSGSLSWVPTNGTQIPDYWIAGGADPTTREKTFICRAFRKPHLVVGRGLNGGKTCIIGLLNKVYRHRKFEVLVLNSYGAAIGAGKMPEIPGPVYAESDGPLTKPMYFKWPYMKLD